MTLQELGENLHPHWSGDVAQDPYRLQRQTQAKHELLGHYLARWARVLSHAGHKDLMYIDGFSFAGMYTSDEDGGPGGPGSPLIALAAFAGEPPVAARGNFLFVEMEKGYAAELEVNIAAWPTKRAGDRWTVRPGAFVDAVQRTLAFLETRAAEAQRFSRGSPSWIDSVVPSFAFIDPYGVVGFPMAVVGRLLALPRSEAFINLMWVRTAANLQNPAVQDAETFTAMLGNEEWRTLLHLREEELRRAFHDLYLARLRAKEGGNVEFVRSFEMCGRDGAVVYWMVFCTKSVRGLQKMKESMWKVDPAGRFRYRDTTARGQLVMFGAVEQVAALRTLLVERFGGRGAVTIEDVEHYVIVDTPFLPSHIKAHLRELEKEGRLFADRKVGGRAGTFPAGTRLRIEARDRP